MLPTTISTGKTLHFQKVKTHGTHIIIKVTNRPYCIMQTVLTLNPTNLSSTSLYRTYNLCCLQMSISKSCQGGLYKLWGKKVRKQKILKYTFIFMHSGQWMCTCYHKGVCQNYVIMNIRRVVSLAVCLIQYIACCEGPKTLIRD